MHSLQEEGSAPGRIGQKRRVRVTTVPSPDWLGTAQVGRAPRRAAPDAGRPAERSARRSVIGPGDAAISKSIPPGGVVTQT